MSFMPAASSQPVPPLYPIEVNGVGLRADLSGALWWPDRRLLAVADLHLEKGSAFAMRGQLLPPYDTAATLSRLAGLIERFRPAQLLCLGDSFHDRQAFARMAPSDMRRLAELVGGTDWVWISGNHDPEAPAGLGGRAVEALRVGALVFRHQAEPGAAGEISGHYHPVAAIATRAGRLRARCFASDGERLILPAFGAYAGGLNLLDPALRPLFGPRVTVLALGRERLHAVASCHLRPDPGPMAELTPRRAARD